MSSSANRPTSTERGSHDAAPGGLAVRIDASIEAHERSLVAAVLGLALALRLAVLFGLRGSPYWTFLLPDERTYDAWARNLLDGAPYFLYSLSPLPAYEVAAVYRIFGAEPVWVRLFHVGLSVLTVWLVHLLARELGGRTVGLISALAVAAYRPFVLLSVTLLKEPLGLLCFASVLVLFLRAWRTPRWTWLVALGAAGGLLANVRQNAAVVLAVFGVALVRSTAPSRRSIAHGVCVATTIGLGYLLPSAPFIVANLRGIGRLSPAPLAGFDLYLGNNPGAQTPFWTPTAFSVPNPDAQAVEFTVEASRRLALAEGSNYWASEVLRTAGQHPLAFARRLGWKALAVLHQHEESDNHSIALLCASVPTLRLAFLTFWMIVPLGLAGLLACALRDGPAKWIGLALLAYGVTMTIWFTNMRIRAPMILALVPFAALGARGLLGAAGWGPRTRLAAAAVLAGATVITCLPLVGTQDLTASYNLHAAALVEAGQREEARRYWEASSAAHGVWSDFANISLALDDGARGDHRAARTRLTAIPDGSAAAAQKYGALASLAEQEGDLNAAAAAAEHSLAVNGSQLLLQIKLLGLYRRLDPMRAAAQELRVQDLMSFYLQQGETSGPTRSSSP
jgi:4-amino-4-deoxy-L-arabinose transferase-like glycosyltransferase